MINEVVNSCQVDSSIIAIVNYSHIIPIFLSLILGLFILFKSKFNFFSKVFFIFIFIFCMWLVGDLITWNSNNNIIIYTIIYIIIYTIIYTIINDIK